VLTVLDAADGALIGKGRIRAPDSDWFVYWGAVPVDGRHVALSYHGGSTSGADWIDVSDDAIDGCQSKGRANGPAGAALGGGVFTENAHRLQIRCRSRTLRRLMEVTATEDRLPLIA
jgi:hypothetical protein